MHLNAIVRRALILGFVVILLGAGYFYFRHKTVPAINKEAPPAGVNAAIAKMQDWQPQIQAAGTLNAEQGVMLKAETAGRITKIRVNSGQNVKAGDILFEINPAVLNAQLAALQAKAALSSGDYQRAVKLYARKVLAQQDLETALSQKNADIANMEAIKAQLDQNIIRAPVSGKLGLKLFNLGDYIEPGQNLINLQGLDRLRVDFYIPENKAAQVKIGDKVFIHADNYPNKSFIGKVTAVDSAADVNTRSVAIRADIANPQEKLLPGSFVQIALYAGRSRPYVTVPQIAVVYDAADNYVYLMENHRAVKKTVLIAEQNDDQAAVSAGIKAGDQVITEGQLKIQEGSAVYAIH